MSSTVAIAESALLTVVRAFLLGILPAGVEVVQGLPNRAAMPAGEFVAMTTASTPRLSQAVTTMDAASQTQATAQPLDWVVHIDAFGPNSWACAMAIYGVWRTELSCERFAPSGLDITPLWAEGPQQLPIVNGERQWERRYRVSLHMQANQVISGLPQQSATSAEINSITSLP